MNDNFSFDGADAADMPLDLSFSSLPLPEGEAAAGFHLPEMEPGTGQEQAAADINLLNGSDVMETTPSPFPAPEDPSETEFRPQLTDPESLHDQGAMMMYGAAEREERRRKDKQARLMDVLRAGAMDGEGRKKAAELWGQDALNRLDLASEHDRAYMLGNRLMETIGDGDRDVGRQIYKNANNLWGTDVVTADQIWKDFQGRHQKTLDAYNENLKRVQTEQEEISRRIVDCVAGKEGSWDACPADLLKYAESPQKAADSIMRARRAYAFAERRGFEDVWRSDALDMADLLTVNVNGNEVLDQQALMLLMTAIDRKVQESQTDSAAFWRNLYRSFADTARGAESLGVKAVQAVRGIPGMSGMEEWYSNNIAPLQGVKDTFDGQRQLFDRYEQRREALNTMQDVMHEFGQRMRGTSPDASWYVKAINGAGNITGQSLSYMAPGGWALALAGDMGHAGNAASRNGDSLVDVTINGLRNTVEEKGFGVFSVFGRMGAINKLMTRTGTGALARLAAKVPGRTFFAGTRTGKMLSTPAFAYVEEMAAEPLAGELFEWTARKLSGMTGMEVKPKDFEVVGPVLQAMGDVEQSGGCALFVAAMAAGHAPRMKQEVAAFVTDAQRAQLAGYTKKHAEEMASFSTAEHKAALAQKYFETDVLKDPEGAAERARKAGAELADRQEARLYQMSGALDKVLEKANIGRIRKLEGTDRYEVSLREGAVVNGVKMEEDRSVEMNEEQTDALVQVVLQGAYLNGVRVMQDAVLGNAAVSEAGKMDFIETLDMLSEEAPAEYRKAAAETGGMTVPGLMDVAARAQARIDAIVREEGVSVQEARSRTDAEVMGKVQLGSIADLAAAFERRLDHAVRSGEITRGRSDEIRNGTAAASFAHRFTMATDPGSSLLLYAGGHVTTANVMEDVQESALVHYMNLTGKDWQDLWEHLQAADAVLGRYGVSLGTYEGPAHDARDVVESFSNLSLSSSLADIESLPVPQWVKDTAEFALKNLEDSARIIRMGEQWNEFAATDEGKKFMEEHGGLAHALQAVGVSTESVFRQARMDAAQKLDVEMVHADLASRRAPGDATMTLGELEALEESMARMDAAEDVEETAEEEDETDPVTGIAGNPASPAPLVEDAGGSLEGVGEEAEHDEEAGAEFRDHAFVRVAPDCVFAQVRVDSLALAPDVEQFKQGDHNERGAVKGRELQGRFREDAQPISVWRRRDGALHVITGRHRFDLAVRDGVEFIPAYVYEEDDAHDATWAKMHDVGQNMLDGQASALEVAFFVRNSNMGRDEMEAQGYLRPGSANVMGWDIATLAGDEVFTRLKNGVITDNEAWKVCRLSSTEAGQMLALQLREKGKPWDYVAAYVKEADRVAAEKSREGEAFDLFGNDTSWQEDCEKVARFAARGISLIAERLSLLKKSRGISRRKDLAGRMGIRLETDADLNAAIHDLERAKGAWQSHDPALRLHDRALAWDGTSEVNPFERVPVSGATFSVVAMDSSGTVLAPETFVTRKDGSPDWFVIPRRKGQPAMPVRLLVGSDIGEHRGYGLTHILASRGFSFWKDRSPERYISSILANVSELYEVAPGRELLVKGRQPSSWMLLQLDRKDGFYSIVSAYPVRQGKKPLGKKLPLAERQPANANSGTARLGPGSASKAALPSQSAGGGDGFSLPQGAHVVNVNEVECRFDDGAIVPATFSLSLEKEAIKKEAVAAGTFMKAPNGKETNLTEDQWLSVRTAAFKNWFGDWEHDPENASKVVDENGEPRVVYHGTYGDFTVFDKARIGSATDYGIWGRGFYFTNMENTPYGNKKLALFLNFRNPFIFNDYKSAEEIGDYLNIWDGNFHEDDRFGIFRPDATGAAQIADSAQERGHDGLIAVLGKWTEYIAFEPNQIKSATDNRGTFDGENPDITFSIASAQGQSLFRDGHFEAGNAVITEPGVTFSIAALHASPHSFRKFSTDFMGKGEGAQAHNYVIFNGNDIKITAFADESTGGAWADYEDPTASFSLATRESVWVTLEREAQKNRLEVLRSQTAKALETWRRVCAANDVKQGDGAEAFGRVMAVVASIYKTLPEGYRFGLYPYMRAAENLATRLEDGQVWLSDELKKETLMDDTSERMDAVIDKLLARTLEQADRYAVDQMRAEMVARIKAVQPTKKASGKFNKGKLSAEDYRHLHGIVAMMNTDQEAKEKRMLELEGVLSSNQSTEEERGAAELELKDWHTFGYLAGMGLEQTRACARALALFITTGRTAWSTRLDEERRRTKFKAEKIVEGLGQATPQGGRDAEEDAKASTRTKAAKYLKYGLQSYSQLLNGWKKIPALRGLAHAEVTAIAEANVALRNMKHARDREVTALVKRCFGVQRTKDVARVLSDFKKTGDSGVVLNPLVKVERTVRIAEAREWVGLSFEEREERRKAIRKEYNDRGLSDDKASVPEALIPEMRRQLAELDELVKAGDGRARRRKNITAKAEVVRPGRKGETLKVSRAQAMYAILLYEQAEYVETMRNEGIGEAEVARLREFVGAEGLAFGYGLRELMNRQGKLLARVYEEREGVPFPAVENYFRAVFRADHKLDTKASFGEQTNAVAGGAKYGMLIPRRKHNLHLAWNMDCEAVFQAASAEVENYICTADITARWRGILADKEAAASLKEHMGRHGIDSLRHWLDVIDGAGVMEGGALLAGAQATSRFQSAKAVALLAWNVLTMLKQTSGLMHGMFAGEVGMGSFLLHLGQTMSMTGRMGVFEMMKTEAFRARTNDAQAELVSQLMGYASDQNYTGAIRFSMAGMRAIEKMDVWSNAVSMAALYNAKWSELEEAGKRTGAPMTEDEMHALCMQSVTRALELVAQPLTQSQKSMLGASTGLFAKMACFMSSEVLNKVGMIVSHVSSGNWGQALALYGMMSVAEQTVIALWHALLDDEDEWEKNGGWFGAMLGAPVAMIGGVPMLGAAVEFGYKQATGQRIYAGTASGVIDYSAIYRAAKNTWKAVTGEKEMTFADWAELILLDAKAAAYVAGAGAGSRSKAADSVASWLLSVAGVANLSKPGFKLAE